MLGLIVILFLIIASFQTIKCLLIYPNPESALNEEAGRQLLEEYDEYAKHAKLWTEIHAAPKGGCLGRTEGDAKLGRKKSEEKKNEKKKNEKKKSLKRL